MRLHNSILFITFVILTLAGFGYPALGQEAIGANTAGETPGVSAPVSPSPAGENAEMVAQPARSAGGSQPAVPAPSQVAYATEWIAETKKSIAVMERVIDHVLSTTLGGDYEISGFFSKGCNGYWIPGTGLCFQMKVRFPLQVPPPPDEPAQPPVGDLWEKFAQELGENQHPAPAYPVPFGPQGNTMDAADSHKVDLLKKQLYAVLADYGHRIQGFPAHEKMVFVIEGQGGAGRMISHADWFNPMLGETSNQPDDVLHSLSDSVAAKQKEIQHKQQELVQKQEEIQKKAEELHMKHQIEQEAQRAEEMANQIEKQVEHITQLADKVIPKDAEWRDFLTNPDMIKQWVPSPEEIQKFMPSPDQMQQMQKAFRFLPSFLGQSDVQGEIIMVIQVRFDELYQSQGKPDLVEQNADVFIY